MAELMHDSDQKMERILTLREGMAFVSENLDAFGFVPDAYPIVTDQWLIAANGRETEVGGATFTYPSFGGVHGLYSTIFNGLLGPKDVATDAMTQTFGADSDRSEHPVARYAAVLSAHVAHSVLREVGMEATRAEVAARLGEALPRALNGLRENICRDGLTARDAELYTAYLGVCRMLDRGNGTYILDWFATGDYRAFLLDCNGLRPLHLPTGAGMTPETPAAPLGGKRMILSHPSPFAVLVLSGSACDVIAVEEQSMKENPGLAWRYRMRLEANILRVITSCAREEEFGERAGRFFMGRANGRESASGAMAIFRGKTPFSSFRADCLARLRRLEDMIALLPDGYDPATLPRLPSRTETEHAYIRRLLSQEHGLAERTNDALCGLALKRLYDQPTETLPPPEGVPDYRRLLPEDIATVHRIYDRENDEDYAGIRQNHAALREYLSEHWVTLRPILLEALDADGDLSEAAEKGKDAADRGANGSTPSDRQRLLCDRAYQAILRINTRLGELLERRRSCMEQLASELSSQALILRTSGGDWLHGRAGADHPAAWADQAELELTNALHIYANTYEETEAEYRSLLSAYMTERSGLFARDAEWADGIFTAEWRSMLEGRMPEERWAAYRAAISESNIESCSEYEELWDDLHVISAGTGARHAQIQGRAADTRMARDIAGRSEFRIAAIRASAYEDHDWGEQVCALLDGTHRNSYLLMVRRWQETCELAARRAAAYEEYRVMYEEFLS